MTEEADGRIRIGTAEREAAMDALSTHLQTGHLEVEEYTQRVGRAAAARTAADLDELFADLPAPHYRPATPPPQALPQPSAPGLAAHWIGSPPPLYGYDLNRPLSHRSKLTAGLLQLLLPFGIGRFYTGHHGMAIAQLLLSVLWIGIVWSLIDGILLLVMGGTDRQGQQLRGYRQ